jgi:hypothetical protein
MKKWTTSQQDGRQKGSSKAHGIKHRGEASEVDRKGGTEAIAEAHGQHAPQERRYSKRQLLASRRWSAREKNQLQALLQDGELYTVSEAELAVQTFKNRRVE